MVSGKTIMRKKIEAAITYDGQIESQKQVASVDEVLGQRGKPTTRATTRTTTTTTTTTMRTTIPIWTQATQSDVKTLLFDGFQINPFPSAIEPRQSVGFSAARVLRLSFHDCLKSSKGTGGCDGCLYYPAPDVEAADNAGLEATAVWLENLYQNTVLPSTGKTLRAAGSSRADLWAFAAFVAVNFTAWTNNQACNGARTWTKSVQCLSQEGESGCTIDMSFVRPSNWFVEGRQDCSPDLSCLVLGQTFSAGYKTCQQSTFPSNNFNGTQLQKWFQDNFEFNATEVVAIMGAHTIGSFHEAKNGFKYSWTSRSEGSFNNQYYRNLVPLDDWQFMDNKCNKVGTAFGVKPHGRWMTKANLHPNFGSPGPLQWILEKHTGPNCNALEDRGWVPRPPDDDPNCGIPNRRCCPRFWNTSQPRTNPAMTFPDNNRNNTSDSVLADNRTGGRAYMGMGDDGGCGYKSDNGDDCERYRIIFGRDDAALTADLAMYLSFEVDTDGFPSGPSACITGIPSSDSWANWTRYYNKTSIPQNRFNFQSCPRNPQMSQFVDSFAQDQNAWVRAFMPTLRKMLANGVVWRSR